MRVKINRVLEIGDRRFSVIVRDGAENKASEIVTPAQIFFPRFWVVGRSATEFFLLGFRKLHPQTVKDALADHVLQSENIVALRIDAVAPEHFARRDVQKLRGHAQTVARTNKSGRKNGMDA